MKVGDKVRCVFPSIPALYHKCGTIAGIHDKDGDNDHLYIEWDDGLKKFRQWNMESSFEVIEEAIPDTLRSAVASTITEKPCKNKTCGKLNDIGSKMCWLCLVENPTDY